MAGASVPFGAWPPRSFPGWHWPNMSHGHRVYRGVGGLGNVDFATPVGIAQCDAAGVSLTGLGHDPSTRYTYAVRPVAGNGWLETPDVSSTVEFETDTDGDWIGERPAPVEWVAATVEEAGKIRLSWSWARPRGGALPSDFGLYCSTSPSITPGSPDATVNYGSDGEYSHTFSLLDGQSYWFAVTSRSAGGVESHLSKIIGPYVADAAGPGQPVVCISRKF